MTFASFASPHIKLGIHHVLEGGVIAYPTEAVWGLGCDPFDVSAVEKILSLKKRSWKKGLILIASDIQQFDFVLHDLPKVDQKKLHNSWPGHNTWLVPHQNRVPQWISGGFDTVALRVSQHPVVKHLCAGIGGPLVSTSANPSGRAPALNRLTARHYFGDLVHYVPGSTGAEMKPSVIRELSTGQVLRA